jgi:hypothetical protein
MSDEYVSRRRVYCVKGHGSQDTGAATQQKYHNIIMYIHTCFDGLDNIHTFDDGSKDNVLAIQPGGLGSTQEELRTYSKVDKQGENLSTLLFH